MNRKKAILFLLGIAVIIFIIKQLSSSSISDISGKRNLAVSINEAVESCLKEYGIQEKWIRRKAIQFQRKKINVKWARIPKDLPFSKINLAIARAVNDSGGVIINGREITRVNRLILTAGYNNITIDSLVLTKDKELTHKKGKIALVVDDFGGDNGEIIDGYLNFPEKITFSIIPGNKYSKEIGESAAKNGFEVIIHLPMESKTPPNKDEKILLRNNMKRTDVENIVKLVTKELSVAKGMSNHMGSKVTENAAIMKYLADALKKRKMFFIDCLTSTKSKGFEVFRKSKAKVLKRDIFLDHEETEEFILAQLDELMRIASKNGKAIGIGHATKEVTYEVLLKEVPKMYKKGYEFVVISDLL